MQLSAIEKQVVDVMHDLPPEKQQSILEFSRFIRQTVLGGEQNRAPQLDEGLTPESILPQPEKPSPETRLEDGLGCMQNKILPQAYETNPAKSCSPRRIFSFHTPLFWKRNGCSGEFMN